MGGTARVRARRGRRGGGIRRRCRPCSARGGRPRGFPRARWRRFRRADPRIRPRFPRRCGRRRAFVVLIGQTSLSVGKSEGGRPEPHREGMVEPFLHEKDARSVGAPDIGPQVEEPLCRDRRGQPRGGASAEGGTEAAHREGDEGDEGLVPVKVEGKGDDFPEPGGVDLEVKEDHLEPVREEDRPVAASRRHRDARPVRFRPCRRRPRRYRPCRRRPRPTCRLPPDLLRSCGEAAGFSWGGISGRRFRPNSVRGLRPVVGGGGRRGRRGVRDAGSGIRGRGCGRAGRAGH